MCLLEPLAPNGPEHPFAGTMINHYKKQKTPLLCLEEYATVESQLKRFQGMGWDGVDIWDLWEAWSGDDFITSTDRCALEAIEPFDDWEEFIIYGQHHFVAYMKSTSPCTKKSQTTQPQTPQPVLHIDITRHNVSRLPKRRFGNMIPWGSAEGYRYGIHAFGQGPDGLLDTCDTYRIGCQKSDPNLPKKAPQPRMGCSFTDLGSFGSLMIGGRRHLSDIQSTCWRLMRGVEGVQEWRNMPSLSLQIFRHSALRLADTSLVLVMGGKTRHGAVYDGCCLLNPTGGLRVCKIVGTVPEGVFGAVLCNASSEQNKGTGVFEGLLAGGMTHDGVLSATKLWWRLDKNGSTPTIAFDKAEIRGAPDSLLNVFGAHVTELGQYSIISGGVASDSHHQGQTITCLHMANGIVDIVGTVSAAVGGQSLPFMIGASTMVDEGDILIAGGGATCFNMGDYWEPSTYRIRFPNLGLRPQSSTAALPALDYMGSPKWDMMSLQGNLDTLTVTAQEAQVQPIVSEYAAPEVYKDTASWDSPNVVAFKNDSYVDKWTPEYMVGKVGKDTQVSLGREIDASRQSD